MIKYSFIATLCITLVSCTINGKHDSLTSEPVNYEAKIDSILALMTIEEKIGQMTQVDQQFLDTIQDLADYGIGSLLSGGGSHPDTNHFEAWTNMYDKYQEVALGLDELSPFILQERVIEYMLDDNNTKRLIDMNLSEFANETSSESPAPGGGSISAYCGAMGAALGTMVANLSAHKRGWDDKWEEFSNWAEKGIAFQNELLRLVDEDTNAFNKIMEAFRLPKDSEEEKALRNDAIQQATKFAITTPYRVMQTAYDSMQVMKAMAEFGNPNSVTDAAVGALCARTAVRGAFLNVKINCGDCQDKDFVNDILTKGQSLVDKATDLEKEIMSITESKL